MFRVDLTCFFKLFFSFGHNFFSCFHRVFSFFKQLGLNFPVKPHLGVILFGFLMRPLNAVAMNFWVEFLSATYKEADVVRVWKAFSKCSNKILCLKEFVEAFVNFIRQYCLFACLLDSMTCKHVENCDRLFLVIFKFSF